MSNLDWKDEYYRQLEEVKNEIPDEEKLRIETIITAKFKENLKRDGNIYFTSSSLLDILEVNKYFNLFAFLGDRGIGKSYDARAKCVEVSKNNRQFLWIRNNDKTKKAFLKSDGFNVWLNENNWMVDKSSGRIFKYADNVEVVEFDSKGKEKKTDNEIITCGWIVDMNTIYSQKSIDYPQVDLIIWEEFDDDSEVKELNDKFISFIETVQRDRTDEVKAYFISNFTNPYNDINAMLGNSVDKIYNDSPLVFDWVVRSITYKIPMGYYKKNRGRNKRSIADRLVLKNPNKFKTDYGGGYRIDKENMTSLNEIEYDNKKHLFNVVITDNLNQYHTLGIYKTIKWDRTGIVEKGKNILLFSKITLIDNMNVPLYIYDKKCVSVFPDAELIELNKFNKFVNWWRNQGILCLWNSDRIVARIFINEIYKNYMGINYNELDTID